MTNSPTLFMEPSGALEENVTAHATERSTIIVKHRQGIQSRPQHGGKCVALIGVSAQGVPFCMARLDDIGNRQDGKQLQGTLVFADHRPNEIRCGLENQFDG